MTDEDRSYRGSRYAEVRDALFANPYRKGKSGEMPGPFPMFKSTIRNAWSGFLPGGHHDLLKLASARAVDSRADLRWGKDGKGFRRMLAPNGICIFGHWDITEDNPYTGYFKKGSKGLAIGRYSSDGSETMRGQRRSLSLAVKIYPTMDPNHPQPLIPAALISQEDLGGMRTAYINDAELTNEPSVTAFRRGIHILVLLRAGMNFVRLDKVADVRQLYEIAELGKPAAEPTRCPRFILLKMAPGQTRIEGERLDFRQEIYSQIFRKPGDSQPSGSIVFDISVSDTGKRGGIPLFQTVTVSDWRRIGKLTFTEAIASYNADHVIQFHHPGWRDQANDVSTAIRANETRVRK